MRVERERSRKGPWPGTKLPESRVLGEAAVCNDQDKASKMFVEEKLQILYEKKNKTYLNRFISAENGSFLGCLQDLGAALR